MPSSKALGLAAAPTFEAPVGWTKQLGNSARVRTDPPLFRDGLRALGRNGEEKWGWSGVPGQKDERRLCPPVAGAPDDHPICRPEHPARQARGVPSQCPQDAALSRRRRRAEGQHPGARLEAEPRRSPCVRREEGRPRRNGWRQAAQGVAGARGRGRHPCRFQGPMPGRGARGGDRDLADGKLHPRRPLTGGRVCRHGGPDRQGRTC